MIVTEKQINQQDTRIGVLNLLGDACQYYGYSVSDEFDIDIEIGVLNNIKSNNCEVDLLLNVFKAARARIIKLENRLKGNK